MSTTQTKQQDKPQPGSDEDLAQRRKELGLAADAPIELIEAAEAKIEKDDPEGDAKEAKVLDFLLGPTKALEFDVETWVDTDAGREKLVFHIVQLDDTKLDELEKEHTTIEGFARTVDRLQLNAAIAAEATLYLEDSKGRQVDPKSKEFRGPIPDTADAMRGRFRFQPGILTGIAEEVRGAAGLLSNRVGEAQQAPGKEPSANGDETIATAVGNS